MPAESINCVFDKAVLDSVLCDENGRTMASQYVYEVNSIDFVFVRVYILPKKPHSNYHSSSDRSRDCWQWMGSL